MDLTTLLVDPDKASKMFLRGIVFECAPRGVSESLIRHTFLFASSTATFVFRFVFVFVNTVRAAATTEPIQPVRSQDDNHLYVCFWCHGHTHYFSTNALPLARVVVTDIRGAHVISSFSAKMADTASVLQALTHTTTSSAKMATDCSSCHGHTLQAVFFQNG